MPRIPPFQLRPRNRLVRRNRWLGDPTVPCIRLKVNILLEAERALSLAGSVSSLGAVEPWVTQSWELFSHVTSKWLEAVEFDLAGRAEGSKMIGRSERVDGGRH